MKLIPLTQGKFALVDDGDFERIGAYKWNFDGRYASRNATYRRGFPRLRIRMHRDILGPPPSGLQCDHKNGNKLDYQRANLRYVTHAQNMQNSKIRKHNTSGVKGVRWDKGKWRATIVVTRKDIYLGRFYTKEEAARAYDAAARIHHGAFARLNFPHLVTPGFPIAV